MANSTFEILECRWVVKPDWTEIYIYITDSSDGIPIGGWRKKIIPPSEPALPFISQALVNLEFFEWDRGAPGRQNTHSDSTKPKER